MEAADKKEEEALIVREHYDRLKREKRGFTQTQLASKFRVSPALVQAWLNGRTRIPDKNMFQLAKLLKFKALAVRPDLYDYIIEARALTAGSPVPGHEVLSQEMRDLSDDDVAMVGDFIRMLKKRHAEN